jgi:L-threonylcarbamoyladenylate synthase
MILTDRIPLVSLLSAGRSSLQKIADRITGGDLFVYPTETIYGIGGRADSKTVEQQIMSVKGRIENAPFILLAADITAFSAFDLQFPPMALLLAEKFWPGNLTLLVQSKKNSSWLGIRVSRYSFINALFSALNVPIFSTSANMSGQPYVNDPDIIFNIFNGKVNFMIDAGILAGSKPSTVVKVYPDNTLEVIREGTIPKNILEKIAGKE